MASFNRSGLQGLTELPGEVKPILIVALGSPEMLPAIPREGRYRDRWDRTGCTGKVIHITEESDARHRSREALPLHCNERRWTVGGSATGVP